jgi:Flp pilus assembly protein TadD
MCRKSVLAATAVTLCLLPLAALAKDKAKEAKPVPAAQAQAAAPKPRTKATPAERATAHRIPPLAAAAFWARETDIDPTDEEAAVGLSQALRMLGNYDDAAIAVGKLLTLNPSSYEGLLELARVQIARNQGFYAIDPARRAEALKPKDWRPVTLLAVAYEQAQRDDEARAAHQRAVALAPDNPTVLSNYAMFCAGHGDSAKAEKLLRAAVAQPDASIQVRQNLALILGLQGRLDEAEKIARQDLPPELVANNMAYLRSVNGVQPAGAAPTGNHTWDTLRATP